MLRYPLIWFVKGWRKFVSPSYGVVCKYHPSCSSYGLTALETHGAVKGVWLTARRLVRCHPWAAGGVDYVPGTPQAAAWAEEISNESRDSHESQPKTEVA